MEWLTDGGWVSNAALTIIVVGYTLVGLIIGGIVGYERAEKRGYERARMARAEEREYWEREQRRLANVSRV